MDSLNTPSPLPPAPHKHTETNAHTTSLFHTYKHINTHTYTHTHTFLLTNRGYPSENIQTWGWVEGIEFPGVSKKYHVEFPVEVKNEVKFPMVTKKK